MRRALLALAMAGLWACAAPQGSSLQPADAATALISGGPITMQQTMMHEDGSGQDPLVTLTLRRTDGRTMMFTQANHTPYDVMAQAAGGPLASVMGLGETDVPVLYSVQQNDALGVPFLCGPDGPQMLGLHTAPTGEVTIVGLKRSFDFEARTDGTYEALPYSPDQVCARLKFRRG